MKPVCTVHKLLFLKKTNICRQLKYHQHRIRSKIGISLEIILNAFKYLIVSLVPLKFLLWQ